MSLSPTCKTAVQQKEKESLLNVHVDAQFFDACKQEKVRYSVSYGTLISESDNDSCCIRSLKSVCNFLQEQSIV